MSNTSIKRKLRMGMVGGGKGAFIGEIHRIAAAIDSQIELVCGAFSADATRSKESGESLYLPANRVYGSYQEMITAERALPADERMDFVSIVTPNHAHFEPAMLALENGFHVVLDKPMTLDLEEARQLQQKVEETGLLFLLTHTYVGYPMVRQARKMVRDGELGKIRKVYVEYPQGWLSRPTEQSGENKQASWRTDPSKSGKSGCMGDIGTHALHLAEFVSGLKTTQLCASLYTYVEGRRLEDDGNILLQFDNGASGVLIASQVAAGEENALKVRVYGENGGLEWNQQEPNTLLVKWLDEPTQVYRANGAGLSAEAQAFCRTPAGHPEGYLEAFANLYRNFAQTIAAKIDGVEPPATALDFPSAADGVRGMLFIDKVVESSASEQKWTKFE